MIFSPSHDVFFKKWILYFKLFLPTSNNEKDNHKNWKIKQVC